MTDKENISNEVMFYHTTASHGPTYLYATLDRAVLLLAKNPGAKQVDVLFHPIVWGFFHPLSELPKLGLRLISRVWRNMKIWVKKKQTFTKPVRNIDEQINEKNGESNEYSGRIDKKSLYYRLYHNGGKILVNTEYGDVTLRVADRFYGLKVILNPLVYFHAYKIWCECHTGNKFDAKKLLNASYLGVQIGVLVASNALRHDPEAGGNLNNCKKILVYLCRAVAIVQYIKKNLLTSLGNSFVSIPEPTYLHEIYKKMLHQNGASILDFHHYSGRPDLIGPDEVPYNPKIYVRNKKKLHPQEKKKAMQYLCERVQKPGKHLWYMFKGVNSTDGIIRNINDEEVEIASEGIYAIVFLHSFDDGQYWYGLDGFNDIYHWTFFTIDALVANSKVSHVLVKPHPNVTMDVHRSDAIAIQRLQERYYSDKKVVWLRKDVGVHAFSDRDDFIGITHHGSVAEELVYLGIPVIGSSFARWGDQVDFLIRWDSPEKYLEILEKIDVYKNSFAKDLALDELCIYVCEYILNSVSLQENSLWVNFMKHIGAESSVNFDNYKEAEKIMREIRCDSLYFQLLLSIINERNKTYREGVAKKSSFTDRTQCR